MSVLCHIFILYTYFSLQIKALGGPDFKRIGPRMLDFEGKEVPGNRGYKYFGAARDLPGVRELFERVSVQACTIVRNYHFCRFHGVYHNLHKIMFF